MAKIYLINVGANSSHSDKARSPIYMDQGGKFEFISFPTDEGRRYPDYAVPYVKPEYMVHTHLDPDWDNLTYGDNCRNRRARALLDVEPDEDDILLFWGLLWRLEKSSQSVWETKDRGWYLVGALRVQAQLESNQSVESLPVSLRARTLSNAHMRGSNVEGRDDIRVFIGNEEYSSRFDCAVDLGIYEEESLLLKAIRTADGQSIEWYSSPRWNSVLRACRAVLDLTRREGYERAKILRDAIKNANADYDLLRNLSVPE